METTQIDDSAAALIARAAAGEEAAFARIVAAHHDDMTRVCYVIAGDLDIADEAVQGAWAIAWRKLPTLRDADRLRPWLVSVAANETRQLVRGRRRRSGRGEDIVADSLLAALDHGRSLRDGDALAAWLLRNATNLGTSMNVRGAGSSSSICQRRPGGVDTRSCRWSSAPAAQGRGGTAWSRATDGPSRRPHDGLSSRREGDTSTGYN